MSLQEAIQQLINALSLGALYALLALGLAAVFGVLGLLNFAYGELVTIAGYTMFALQDTGLPLVVVVLIAVAAGVVGSLVMELVAFRPLRDASFVTVLFSSFAVAVIVQNLVRQFVSPRPQGVPPPGWFDSVLRMGPLVISAQSLVTLAVGAVAVVVLGTLLQRSRWGLAMRAAAADFETVRLMGARANRIISLAFAVSGLLAGIAGILWVARRGTVTPAMGFVPILKAFIAVVIGGLGSLQGAMIGGFVLALVEVGLEVLLPSGARPFTDAFSLLIVVAILYFRPQGLVGRQVPA
jgi:branched-chain amino acid transport system permease protein